MGPRSSDVPPDARSGRGQYRGSAFKHKGKKKLKKK